jgi:hypothetical protein
MDPNQDRAAQAAFDGYVPQRELDEALAEIERLTAAERAAFTAGFWVFCGPSTNAEHAALDKQEQEAWEAYRSEQQETPKP